MVDHRPILLCAASAAAGVAVGLVISRVTKDVFGTGAKKSIQADENSGLSDLALLLEAAHFSAQKHRDQRRKNSTQAPYICHPISVARRLAVDGGVRDVNVLIAALLHDTVEDTDTTLAEVESAFGAHVAEIVDEVTDDKSLPKDVRKQLQIENAPRASPQAKLVKLGDKLDNLSDLLADTPIGWQSDRVGQYFDWSKSVSTGLKGTNQALEEMLRNVLDQKETAMKLADAP